MFIKKLICSNERAPDNDTRHMEKKGHVLEESSLIECHERRIRVWINISK